MVADHEDDEACTCDICAMMSNEQQAAIGKTYIEQLEAENYDLQKQVADLEEELAQEQTRCQCCGRHK